jgi:fibronectin-binding autotransporter adhesin
MQSFFSTRGPLSSAIISAATHSFAGGEAFTVAGVPIAGDSALIEAGFDLNVTEAATMGVSYQGQFGSGV